MSAVAALSNVADARRMKSELQELRRRGALRPSDECPLGDGRSCNRCRAELGWIVNRGAVCQACRLRVCKACREYTVRTVDWVCTVCYKRSQIQAVSGEWMNEFVRKPGQWKDNKFYMSAADIIKSTIKRSWTICDPNPRWPTSRDSPDFRPYNSLPRGRDVSDYPSLTTQHDSARKQTYSTSELLSSDTFDDKTDQDTEDDNHSPRQRRISQFERTLSELYGSQKKPARRSSAAETNDSDRNSLQEQCQSQNPPVPNGTENKKCAELKPSKIPSPRKRIQYARSEAGAIAETSKQVKKQNCAQAKKSCSAEGAAQEKHVSFDEEGSKRLQRNNECSPIKTETVPLKSGIPKRDAKFRSAPRSEPKSIEISNAPEEAAPEEEEEKVSAPVESKCDVEELSGTVFRKVTIRRRLKKTHAFDEVGPSANASSSASTRRKHRHHHHYQYQYQYQHQQPHYQPPPDPTEAARILLPEGDDYKLVFISSDSSSKEEDADDNDSVSSSSATTAHSFTLDECDWDYFEPASASAPGAVRPVLCWSPFGSPRVYRRSGVGVGPLDSPIGSPIVYRRARARESDTGTDEDVTRIDSGSPASSDSAGFLSRVRTSSDTDTTDTMDAAGLCRRRFRPPPAHQQRSRDPPDVVAATTAASSTLVSRPACQTCGSSPAVAAAPATQFVPIPVLVPIPVPVPAVWNPLDPVILYNTSDALDANLRSRLRAIQQRWLWPCVNPASLISPLISAGGDGGGGGALLSVQQSVCAPAPDTDVPTAEANTPAAPDRNTLAEHAPTTTHAIADMAEPSSSADHAAAVAAAVTEGGYLATEFAYLSSSDSESTGAEDEGIGKRRARGTYNVTGCADRDSDDALPTTDDEDDGDPPDGDDDLSSSSSGTGDTDTGTDTDTDTDDTGTVADQKSRKFSRVFVVNTNDSSSDVEDNADTSPGTGTDTEQEAVVLVRHTRSSEESAAPIDTGVVLLSHVVYGDNGAAHYRKSETGPGPRDIDLDPAHNLIKLSNSRAALEEGAEDEDGNEGGDGEPTVDQELIGDCASASANSSASANAASANSGDRACDESKQSAIDLETGSEPSAECDMKAAAPDEYDGSFPQEKSGRVIGAQSEVSTSDGSGSEWSEGCAGTDGDGRCADPVRWPGVGAGASAGAGDVVEVAGQRTGGSGSERGARTGAPAAVDNETAAGRHAPAPAARYTSLVMITQEPRAQVSVVSTDTTTIVPADDVVVRHTNWQPNAGMHSPPPVPPPSLAEYFALALDSPVAPGRAPRKPVLVSARSANYPNNSNNLNNPNNETATAVTILAGAGVDTLVLADSDPANGVTVVTGADTLSAVVCLEEGLADDDSWVEDVSHDEDEFATTTATDSSSGEEVTLSPHMDQEEELRGYHRAAIDFTLHTIVEESCEESEVEQSQASNKPRPTSATDLEKYFFFRLGDGTVPNVSTGREDTFSETSSIYSEGMDSLSTAEDANNDGGDPAELASSRLEKYFLGMGFTGERRDSDGSVGSDSEGKPSPEQRRKRLVRARGTGRSHSSSLDNLLANAELSGAEPQLTDPQQLSSEDSSSSETDTYDEATSNFEKSDGQFDTVKRKKCKKQRGISGGSSSPHDDKKALETTVEVMNEDRESDDDDDGHKTPQPEFLLPLSADLANSRKQQSRDSGFIGSCDDLLKEQKVHSDTCANNDISATAKTLELKTDLEKIAEEKRVTDDKLDKPLHYSTPPATTLTRKDSFNNWSSDEETNLMMSKMRQFFKTMVANSSNAHLNSSSKPTTPVLGKQGSPHPVPSPRTKNRSKPPQLVYFENELTRLMKTVPGIRDDQVREIVEYLSSEDTWSDSYDSSDYTSSDLEGTAVAQKSALQQQISASCQQIINKFDKSVEDEEGDEGDGGILDESHGLNRETAFVYQKLVASLNKMTAGEAYERDASTQHTPHNSPPLIAKVMHHIGSRLVALMHEVSSGESHCSTSTSPKVRYHHRRLQQKLSSASTTTTEDDDSTSDSNLPERLSGLEDSVGGYTVLPRSRSHDLLLGEARTHHQSSSGVSDIAEEREASDYERFSWRGSFESALMATDSRTKLSLLGAEGSASASALAMAAKRRSAGDLLFSPKSLSREQLDRVRSCGSIGGGSSEEKHWVVTTAVRPNRRRSSVPDATCGSGGSADGEDDDDEDMEGRSTLPRSLQANAATTNSLPRLPTTSAAANMQKAHSMHHFLQHNVKSARYRPPGFSRSAAPAGPKRAASAPGLQPSHPRRDARRRSHQHPVSADDVSLTESNSSPIVGPRSGSKSASPSPIHGNTLTRGTGSISSADWHSNDDDIDRLVAMHQNKSLSSLGLRSDSMASVYSGAGEGRYGIVAVRGQVEFGLQYNYKAGALEIHIKQCRDLAAVDIKRNRSDPYVKVYLLPDKSKSGKRKTKVKKHTLNPVFDECLKFHLSLNGLETRTLWLTVWHSDMFGRNDFLGEVMMPLENKVFDDPTPKWYNLQERTEPFEDLASYKGDIIVGLKFVPPDMSVQKKGKRSRGALHVLVKEAKSLSAVKANGTSDPFCKSYLLPDKGRSNKQKTPILRRTTNPVWNHTFVYDDVTLQELAERALELTVWDHDRLASNEFLGGVRFSLGTGKHYGKSVDWMDASGKELSLWQSMLERPNFWVEGCVTLRSSLDNRNS